MLHACHQAIAGVIWQRDQQPTSESAAPQAAAAQEEAVDEPPPLLLRAPAQLAQELQHEPGPDSAAVQATTWHTGHTPAAKLQPVTLSTQGCVGATDLVAHAHAAVTSTVDRKSAEQQQTGWLGGPETSGANGAIQLRRLHAQLWQAERICREAVQCLDAGTQVPPQFATQLSALAVQAQPECHEHICFQCSLDRQRAKLHTNTFPSAALLACRMAIHAWVLHTSSHLHDQASDQHCKEAPHEQIALLPGPSQAADA